jgi:hypothetical protein
LRRRLIHCQGRTPSYFQARFAQIPQELEDRPNNTKRNPNLIGTNNHQTNRKILTKRPISLSDQYKTPRTGYTSVLLDKDQFVTRTRHTT